jgi:serine/threonine protein kinase
MVAGRYRLLDPLGSGGMGTVWRAEDLVLGRTVAVKEVVFPHGLSDEDRDVLRERTRREARAAARLDHPSAVTVYDVVEEDGAPYLVMELVEARTLSQVVRSDGPLPPERTARIGLALLGALEAAHRQGIVHRDVKPGNVLLGGPEQGERVVLTDFGIASSVGDSSITSTGLLLGSPSYIAPERARGQAPAPASDLWSLGATLFTAVEGKPPYDAGEPLATVTAVVSGDRAPFVRAGRLAPVLEGLLERDPARRLSPSDARRALQQVATEPPAAPMTAKPAAAQPTPPDAAHAPTPPTTRAERTAALPVHDVREAADAGRPAQSERPGWSRPPRVPPRTPPTRRRSRLPLLLTAVLLALAAGVVALVVVNDPGGSGSRALRGGPSATPEATGEATRGAKPPLPEGWTRYEDEEGWSVGVPPGYERSTYRETQVQFRDPQARRSLRIDHTDDPKPSALKAWQDFSPQLAQVLDQYQELRLEEVDYKGLDAADLEFTYFDETQLRVLDRTFVTEDGDEAFALYWQVHASDWDEALPLFERIAATFDPGS